jgi:hypothetical protein
MSPLAQKLQDVVDAYNWEQNQIALWKGMMANVQFLSNSPVTPTFKAIWNSYFDFVAISNGVIIQYCSDAIATGKDSEIKKAIDKLNEKEHEQARVEAVEKEAKKHTPYSDYFTQLDELMNLEVQARTYIETYLNSAASRV